MSISKWWGVLTLILCVGCPKKPEPEVPQYQPVELPDDDLDDLPEEPDPQESSMYSTP